MSEIRNIRSFLSEELDEAILYVANHGNAGDALMACATYDMFRQCGLAYTNCSHDFVLNSKNVENKVVVLSGGGNLNERGFNKYASLLSKVHRVAKKVIILPHTINGNNGLLADLDRNVILICRERASYEHACRVAIGGARIYLAPDMALSLDVEAALKHDPRYLLSLLSKIGIRAIDKKRSQVYPSIQHYFSGLRWAGSSYKALGVGGSEAFLFRTDIESTDINIPDGNIDASLKFAFGVSSEIKARFTVLHLLRFLESLQVIHTNRLHIAIASALLGKEVHLHANNYFKIRAVYEYSIRGRFKNVVWHD